MLIPERNSLRFMQMHCLEVLTSRVDASDKSPSCTTATWQLNCFHITSVTIIY